jgi:hypothetical protein
MTINETRKESKKLTMKKMDLRSKIPEKPECRPIVFQIPEALPHFVH